MPALLGVVLIVGGAAWLLGNLVQVDLGRYGWPLFVIVPGVILLVAGLSTASDAGVGMMVGGCVITAVGLLLAFQNATDLWATWAYAWALVAPLGPGIGLMLAGWRYRRPALVDRGRTSALVGAALFVAGLVFFEGLIGLSGRQLLTLSATTWAVLLIVVGVVWVIAALLRQRRGPTHPG